MKEGTRNALVGLFVLSSLAMLSVLMVWFGETPSWLPSSEWMLRITGVRDLQGVGEGSPVYLNGVSIGRVTSIEFEDEQRPDQGVVVHARIKKKHTVPVGATARLYGATLGIGSGRVEIVVEPGRGITPLPKEGAEILGEMRSVVGEIITQDTISSINRAIANIGNLTEAWTPVGGNLATLIESRSVADVGQIGAAERGITPNLATAIERIDTLVAHLNAVMGDEDVQGDVKLAVRDLREAAVALRETTEAWKRETQRLAENLNDGVDQTKQNLDGSFRNLNEVLDHLDASASNLAGIMADVAAGKGTAGLLASDKRLYESAVVALDRFGDVMLDLKAITGKIKEDGYIVVGQAPSGVLRKKFQVPSQTASP